MALYVVVNIAIVVVLGLIARFFRQMTEVSSKILFSMERNTMAAKKSGWNFNYTTRDIVIIAVIAAITGVVNTGVGNLWYLANTSLGPLGGALLQGAFMWAYILAVWLIRKPGVALIVGIIEAQN